MTKEMRKGLTSYGDSGFLLFLRNLMAMDTKEMIRALPVDSVVTCW